MQSPDRRGRRRPARHPRAEWFGFRGRHDETDGVVDRADASTTPPTRSTRRSGSPAPRSSPASTRRRSSARSSRARPARRVRLPLRGRSSPTAATGRRPLAAGCAGSLEPGRIGCVIARTPSTPSLPGGTSVTLLAVYDGRLRPTAWPAARRTCTRLHRGVRRHRRPRRAAHPRRRRRPRDPAARGLDRLVHARHHPPRGQPRRPARSSCVMRTPACPRPATPCMTFPPESSPTRALPRGARRCRPGPPERGRAARRRATSRSRDSCRSRDAVRR